MSVDHSSAHTGGEDGREELRADRISAALGGKPPQEATLFVLFVPSVDRHGKRIDQDAWVDGALATFTRLFQGATAYAPGIGKWRDDEHGGELVTDHPVVVTCHASPADVSDDALSELRRFLHQLGREANQAEVRLVVDTTDYRITEYDE